jgi:hypothetical protein
MGKGSSGSGRGGSGKSGGSSKSAMTPQTASRIQSAGDRNPKSDTAKSSFASRAQSSAAKHEQKNGK